MKWFVGLQYTAIDKRLSPARMLFYYLLILSHHFYDNNVDLIDIINLVAQSSFINKNKSSQKMTKHID